MKALLAIIFTMSTLAFADDVQPGKNGQRPKETPNETLLFKVDKDTNEVSVAVIEKAELSNNDLEATIAQKDLKFEKIPQTLIKNTKDELERDAAHQSWYWVSWNYNFYWGGYYYQPYWTYYYPRYYGNCYYYAYNWYWNYNYYRPWYYYR